MQLEDVLRPGDPMVPREHLDLFNVDGALIGTFRIAERPVLFWAMDPHDNPVMRYAYVELTDEEAAKLPSTLSSHRGYKNHPLLTGRRVVAGLSDEQRMLVRLAVIDQSSEDVFAQIEQLLPVAHDQ